MSQEPRPIDPLEDARVGFHWLCLIVDAYAFVIKVFLHGNFGARAFGGRALLAWGLIMVHGLCWHPSNIVPIGLLWCVYFGMCLVHSVHRHWRYFRGSLHHTHSRYDGTPWLLYWYPHWPELRVKQVVEPFIVAIAGLLIGTWNGPLGSILAIAAACQCMGYSFGQAVTHDREFDLNDQLIEMRYYGNRLRRK